MYLRFLETMLGRAWRCFLSPWTGLSSHFFLAIFRISQDNISSANPIPFRTPTTMSDHEPSACFDLDEAERLLPSNQQCGSANTNRLALSVCFAIVFSGTLLGSLMATPVLRLFESCVCRAYYLQHDPTILEPAGDVREELCKKSDIQIEVAMINSSIGFITSLLCQSVRQSVNQRGVLLRLY